MTLSETTELLAVLKMAWPSHVLDIELGSAVYHRALADIPFELGNRAVDEWLRTGKFFPAPSEIRELAVRAGLGLPAAEIAWDEAQRVIRDYRPGDAPPQWSSRVLEETVNSVGWGAIKACDLEHVGTLRAQFRDSYNARLRRMTASDAGYALREATERRVLAAHEGPARSAAMPEPALPATPETDGESWTLRKFRRRFDAQRPPAVDEAPTGWTKLPDELSAFRALPEHRRRQLVDEER